MTKGRTQARFASLLVLLVSAVGCGGGSSSAPGAGGTGGGGGSGAVGGAWFEVIEPLPNSIVQPEDDPDLVRNETVVFGASADGDVLIGQSWVLVTSGAVRQTGEGFRWTRGEGVQSLGYPSEPAPDERHVTPRTISRDGSVIVGTYGVGVYAPAFRWTAASGMIPLRDAGASTSVTLGDVSDAGDVVVGTEVVGTAQEAVRWTEEDGFVGLGLLPGAAWSSGLQVSADGRAVAGLAVTAVYRWTAGSGMEDLALSPCSLAPGGLSSDGAVIVGQCTAADGAVEGFVWTERTGKQSLGTLVATMTARSASPEAGVFVGQSQIGREDYQGVRGSVASGLVRLGALPGLPTCFLLGADSFGRAEGRRPLSSDGALVAGTCITTSGFTEDRGFRWTEDEGLLPLEPLAGHLATRVTSVSPEGIVGGLSTGEPGEAEVVIWDADGTPRALGAELAAAGVELGGFRLDDDLVVLAGGRIVYGLGHDPAGAVRAWVAHRN